MFEDATFDSRGIAPSQTPRWMLLTLAVNCTATAAMIALPLLYPPALPSLLLHSMLYTPPIAHVVTAAPRISQPAASLARTILYPDTRQRITPGKPSAENNETATESPTLWTGLGGVEQDNGQMGSGPVTSIFTGAAPTVRQGTSAAVRISQGVFEGLLLRRVNPSYPAIAREMRVSGSVVLEATISKTGSIEDLTVLSGHPMLRQAAIEAVREWRYRPYLLNGQPVEVHTTIDIHFTMTP